jgi:Pvc16 N-terminal domain/IPT/TIG domain
MSGALAIAAVTATLKDLLNDGLLNHDLSQVGSFSVTASPPDRVTTGQNEPNQLNLFLYQVTPNLGWRNVDLPSRDSTGSARLTNPPLALDLHYMLTAYGSQDFNAEILLGYAMQLLHETPILTRDQLETVLGNPSPVNGSVLPPLFGNLSALDLADQVELIKISPVYLSTEELSKMWTAMQARYRPTMAYLVSVVLIQATDPIVSAPPVLKRARQQTIAGAIPGVMSIQPVASSMLPAMRLGDDLLLTGTGLTASGATAAVFNNSDSALTETLATTASTSPAGLKVHVPSVAEDANALNEWAIGAYGVTLNIPQSPAPAWIALAPTIKVSPLTGAAGDTVTITCTPRLIDDQGAQSKVFFGSQSVTGAVFTTPADTSKPTTITFQIPAVASGKYLVRLVVQGISSLPITISSTGELDFDPNQQVTVP